MGFPLNMLSLFFDLGLQSYEEETFHALYGSKCQQRN